jgi:hypothetical protein
MIIQTVIINQEDATENSLMALKREKSTREGKGLLYPPMLKL